MILISADNNSATATSHECDACGGIGLIWTGIDATSGCSLCDKCHGSGYMS